MSKSRGRSEKPLWQVGRKDAKPQGNTVMLRDEHGKTVTLKGRHADNYTKQLADHQKRVKAGQLPPDAGLTARTGAWRFRFHLVPGMWALAMASG